LKLPVKLIVFNNSSLAFVELKMKAAGIPDFGTRPRNPILPKMPEAAGILGLRAETSDQIKPMIEQALGHDGPPLLKRP
jgi:pyruvate dehydrogenase (quinone)